MAQPEVELIELIELNENQLRELVNAQATWRAFEQARREARLVRGSMVWKKSGNGTYLIRVSTTGAQTSLGPQDERTQAMYDAFHQRKEPAQQRLKALKARLEEQRKLNRVYRVGRTPTVVVRALAEIAAADMANQFMVIGTHALYAYEMAAGVLVQTSAMATRDLAIAALRPESRANVLIALLKRADPTFRLNRKRQVAVNDAGYAIRTIAHAACDEALATGRKFEHLVVAPNGEMASMRTIHPLDFIRLKTQLADLPTRDPQKAPKDRLQAQVVQALWDGYLHRLG